MRAGGGISPPPPRSLLPVLIVRPLIVKPGATLGGSFLRQFSLESPGAHGPGPRRLTLHPVLHRHVDSHCLSVLMGLLHSAPVPAFIRLGDRVQVQGDDLAVLVAVHKGLAGAVILGGQGAAAFVAPLTPVLLKGVELAGEVAGELEGLSQPSRDVLGCLEAWFSWSREGETGAEVGPGDAAGK